MLAGSIPKGERKDFISKGKNQLKLFACRILSKIIVFYANRNLFLGGPQTKIMYAGHIKILQPGKI
jgi:hypothetical protein